MSRKSRIVVMFFTAALVALSLCAVSAAMAKSPSSSKVLRYTVVKRAAHYEVVRGHHHRFAVRHGAHKVILHGVERYQIVRRTHRYVVLRALSHDVTAKPTIISPNGGELALGVSTTITWEMSSAVSSGYYRVSLKNTVNGASTRLTASKISTHRGVTNCSVPWNVTQAVGTYKLWVYYYSPGGRVIGSDVSDGTLSIVPAATPTPTPTVTPAPTATPTPTSTPFPTLPSYSVKDFGAIGDGVTDDYDAIQRAINACGTAGGVVLFPKGTYFLAKSAAGGLKLPAGNSGLLTLSGYGATIRLSAGVPRFLDFNRTADHQTFAHFRVEGFGVDAANVGGGNHVIGFAYINGQSLQRINAHDITVRDVHAYNIAAATTAGTFRVGVHIATYQWSRDEATTNSITDINIENVTLEGGSTGFWIGGVDYAGVGYATDPTDTNIEIDNVRLDGCSWDSGVRGVSWPGNGMLMGNGARCGSLYVNNCVFRGSGDNNFEVNGWQHALVQNCVSEDAYWCGYYFSNNGWPIGGTETQQVTWRNCINRDTVSTSGNRGWNIGNHLPAGTLTLDGCSSTSVNTGAANADFLSMPWAQACTLKALNLLNCSYTATGLVVSANSWPFIVNVRCDGAPGGGPATVTVDGFKMYFRSTRVGTPAYYVRLMGIFGSNFVWNVRNCQYDAAIVNGASSALRVLSLGEGMDIASQGSGVIDRCTFKTDALDPWAIGVGDSRTLTIDGTITVQNCDFSGVNPDCTPIHVTPDDVNATKVRAVNNIM